MVTDKDKNVVYLSRILRENVRFSESCSRLSAILGQNRIEVKFLESTNDIWCRDYMAVQVRKKRFVQFRYQPSYLVGTPELQSDPSVINQANGIRTEYSNINLDGGNLVSCMDRAIVTDRVFEENPEYLNKKDLIRELENLLEVEIIVIPQITSDMTGHADGLVRFFDRTTLIGNDRNKEYSYWTNGIAKVLRDYHLDYIDVPFFQDRNQNYPHSARGCYINFLEAKKLILLPVFGTTDNMDRDVFDLFKGLYPGRNVETININEIANEGGLLNCITWAIQK